MTDLHVGVLPAGLDAPGFDYIRRAEQLGVDSVWMPEAWMYDALTPLGYLAAITSRVRLVTGVVQLGARSPAMLAMSALALAKMSEGRFVLGLGTSGPQVMEGWHGVRFDRPVIRTSETIDIIHKVCSGDRLTYEGKVYELPLPDSQGRSLRSPVAGSSIPIYIASMGPANLRLTGAKSDGWIGTAFLPESASVFTDHIREGAESTGRSLDDIELTVAVTLDFSDDPEAAGRRHADGYAFTIGAMGSSSTNFYNQAFIRQGFGDAVEEVQRLWQSGEREAAAAAVPIEIGLRTNLLGGDAEISERLRAYRATGIRTLRVRVDTDDPTARLDSLARLMDLVRAVNQE
ncbi:LLM class flavin-dependent oxidoreductase [Candidatus Poriferisodalis sp.]|uniref:LLM class flavin-dependent oxidoreductase n=1 Tax=Candidatus Poriferisodalis sp. TaxID=3101277 RepID=UPI003B014B37